MQVDAETVRKITKITSTGQNSNGCPIPATYFTLVDGSSCSVIRDRFKKGDEFACHTLTHKELTPDVSRSTMVKEIGGSRDWLIKKCGLPSKAVTGYRSTYLTSNPKVRKVKKYTQYLYSLCNVQLSTFFLLSLSPSKTLLNKNSN